MLETQSLFLRAELVDMGMWSSGLRQDQTFLPSVSKTLVTPGNLLVPRLQFYGFPLFCVPSVRPGRAGVTHEQVHIHSFIILTIHLLTDMPTHSLELHSPILYLSFIHPSTHPSSTYPSTHLLSTHLSPYSFTHPNTHPPVHQNLPIYIAI